MARYYWLIAVLAFALMAAGLTQAGGEKDKDKDLRVQAKFSKDDPKDAQRGGPSQTHPFQMKAGKFYTIDMVSTELDSYLRLMDAKGNQLAEDDDGGGSLNARILFNTRAFGRANSTYCAWDREAVAGCSSQCQ